jgi:AcrR family transcriptional regulator
MIRVKRDLRVERCSWYAVAAMRSTDAEPSARASTAQHSLPTPPWRADTRARTEPRIPLTRDSIIDAALRVLDRSGIDGLSMRRVAEEVGTGVASLYWHVHNKEELLQLLNERLVSEIVLPPPDPSRWQEQLKAVARQMRAGAHRHRDGARLTLGRLPSAPAIARFSEWLFELLTPLDIPDRVIAYVGDIASLYVGAYAFEESLGIASPTGEDLPAERIVAMLRAYLLSLPAEQFPHVHRAVDDLFAGDADERFEFGLDVIVRGIGTYAALSGDGGAKLDHTSAAGTETQP